VSLIIGLKARDIPTKQLERIHESSGQTTTSKGAQHLEQCQGKDPITPVLPHTAALQGIVFGCFKDTRE